MKGFLHIFGSAAILIGGFWLAERSFIAALIFVVILGGVILAGLKDIFKGGGGPDIGGDGGD